MHLPGAENSGFILLAILVLAQLLALFAVPFVVMAGVRWLTRLAGRPLRGAGLVLLALGLYIGVSLLDASADLRTVTSRVFQPHATGGVMGLLRGAGLVLFGAGVLRMLIDLAAAALGYGGPSRAEVPAPSAAMRAEIARLRVPREASAGGEPSFTASPPGAGERDVV